MIYSICLHINSLIISTFMAVFIFVSGLLSTKIAVVVLFISDFVKDLKTNSSIRRPLIFGRCRCFAKQKKERVPDKGKSKNGMEHG